MTKFTFLCIIYTHMSKTKELTEKIDFTLKSLIYVAIFCVVGIVTLTTTVGFSDNLHTVLTSMFCGIIVLAYISYFTIVLCLYHKLPKNKEKYMGVLFVVDTRQNHADYKAICEKFIDNFSSLSPSFHNNVLKPIVLSEKNISTRKVKQAFYNIDMQTALLKKTNCSFGVFLKTTDTGRNSDFYELTLNATMLHNKFDPNIQKVFQNNFSYIFKELRKETLNRTDELQNLKNTSTKLFIVCQLIYATAYEYSLQTQKAVTLFNELLISISEATDSFYVNIKRIVVHEIYACFAINALFEYENYIENGKYNSDNLLHYSNFVHPILKTLNITCQINYYNTLATIYVLQGNLNEAKKIINYLRQNNKKVQHNKRWWEYSYAFILACSDNPKKYPSIITAYREIRNNLMSANNIWNFINRYYNAHKTSLGIKIAIYSLYYYRKDINRDELSSQFPLDLIKELEEKGYTQTANILSAMFNKKNHS